MDNRGSAQRGGMVLGAAMVGIGIVLGATLFGGSAGSLAFGQEREDWNDRSLPAVTMGPAEIALLKDRTGQYFIVNSVGRTWPVRLKNTELRTIPGESFLFAP